MMITFTCVKQRSRQMTKHNKALGFQVKQLGQDDDRTLRFIGSTEAEDRDGDVLAINGWELDNYRKNPVFLWAHDYSIPPIGKTIKLAVEHGKLMFDVQFPEVGIYPLADTVYELYRKGFLNATSVGFIGKEGTPIATGVRFTRQELLELSAVPVPSNPTALQQAKAKGYISANTQKFFDDSEDGMIEIVEDNGMIEVMIEEGSNAYSALKGLIQQTVKDTLHDKR